MMTTYHPCGLDTIALASGYYDAAIDDWHPYVVWDLSAACRTLCVNHDYGVVYDISYGGHSTAVNGLENRTIALELVMDMPGSGSMVHSIHACNQIALVYARPS